MQRVSIKSRSQFLLSRLFLSVAVTTLVAACASGPTIRSNQDPGANFSAYQTYGFEPVLGTDRPGGNQSLLSQYMKTAAAREMQLRGYRLADDPDLLVNFYVHTQEKIRTTQTPSSSGYYGYRGGRYGTYSGYGYGGGTETTVTQYTEGTVNIDVIDAKRKQLVWEGVAVGRVSKDVMDRLEAAANAVVTEIFAEYPQTAGGKGPLIIQK
jgi:hypothetical protein